VIAPMLALRDWQNFYLLTGTAAATLMGLLFVAASISVGVTSTVRHAAATIRTFVTPILLSYAHVLLISCLAVMPLQNTLILGAVLVAQGSFSILLAAKVLWRMLVLHREEADLGHWLWHCALPFLAGTLFVATALGFLQGQSLALAGLAITDLLYLTIGVRNSWTLTIWLILNQRKERSNNTEKPEELADLAALAGEKLAEDAL
jgi:hypothetical protein